MISEMNFIKSEPKYTKSSTSILRVATIGLFKIGDSNFATKLDSVIKDQNFKKIVIYASFYDALKCRDRVLKRIENLKEYYLKKYDSAYNINIGFRHYVSKKDRIVRSFIRDYYECDSFEKYCEENTLIILLHNDDISDDVIKYYTVLVNYTKSDYDNSTHEDALSIKYIEHNIEARLEENKLKSEEER